MWIEWQWNACNKIIVCIKLVQKYVMLYTWLMKHEIDSDYRFRLIKFPK